MPKKDGTKIRIPKDPRVLLKGLRTQKLKCDRSTLARLLGVSEGVMRRLESCKKWPNLHKRTLLKAKRLYYLCGILPPIDIDTSYNRLVLWLEIPHPMLNFARPIDLLDSEGGRRVLKSFIEETGPDVEWPE